MAANKMKFDVIIGNPPYQENLNKTTLDNKGKDAKPIWQRMVQMTMGLVNDNGYLAMITPATWATGGDVGGKSHVYTNCLKNFDSKIIDMNVDHYFKVGIRIGWFLIQKKEYTGKTLIIDIDHTECEVNLNEYAFLPLNLTVNSLSIFKKILSADHYQFKASTKTDSSSKKVIFAKTRYVRYRDGLLFNQSDLKSGQNANYCDLPTLNDHEFESVKSQFNSKLFEYLYDLLGGNLGMSKTWIMSTMPKLSFDKIWTNDMIACWFEFNQDEQLEISY